MLVVDAKGFLEAGPWGDVLTAAAVKLGIAGLVIHGAVRDASAIVEMGFPVFCRGLSIKGTSKVQAGQVNVPVCIGDVVIRPGDIIVGDRDGLVVVAADKVAVGARQRPGPGSQGGRVPIGHREGREHSRAVGAHADPRRSGTALTRPSRMCAPQ